MIYLIDGYNVLRQVPSLLKEERKSLQEGREAFISDLVRLGKRYKKENFIVVFDGQEGIFELPLRIERVEVLYSKGEIADELIKRLIKNRKISGEIVLVTDDREIREFAILNGVISESVSKFSQKLYPNRKKSHATNPCTGVVVKLGREKVRILEEELKRTFKI